MKRNGDRKMSKETNTPESILAQAKKRGIKKFYVLMSGGKDSITTAHVTNKILGGIDGVCFIDTTIGLPETKAFVERLCKEQGWELHILNPPNKNYEEFVMAYGFPKAPMHRAVMTELKWKSMVSWWRKRPDNQEITFVSGIRRKESSRRMRTAEPFSYDKGTTTKKKKGMAFIAPLYDWSDQQVWDYIKEHDLEISPAYKTLHISGDCLCGAYADFKEAELLNIFHPETAERIRCLEKKRSEKCEGCPNNTWGNHSSLEGTKEQTSMENFICGECQVR